MSKVFPKAVTFCFGAYVIDTFVQDILRSLLRKQRLADTAPGTVAWYVLICIEAGLVVFLFWTMFKKDILSTRSN